MQQYRRGLGMSTLGNTLEWLDFGLFVYLAPFIGEHFFPTCDQKMATLAAFSVFAAGFVCRPLGGIIFGYFGDRFGRASSLRISVLSITIATLCTGMIPTYWQIGPISSFLFVLLRLIQGISVGGEYGGVMIYLTEMAPPNRRGFFTSFSATGANLGFLLASLITLLLNQTLTQTSLASFGWRIPFLGVGLIGALLAWYRLSLPETPVYLQIRKRGQIQHNPLWTSLRHAPKHLLRMIGLVAMGNVFYYVFLGYMPQYLAKQRGIETNTTLTIQSLSLTAMLLLVPLAGLLGDRWGRKKVLIATALAIILLAIPCIYLIGQQNVVLLALGFSIVTLLSSLDQGNSLTVLVEHCPAPIRYSAVSFAYNLGVALFGGTAPLAIAFLSQNQGQYSSACYLMAVTSITLLALTTLPDQNEPCLSSNHLSPVRTGDSQITPT